MLLFTPSIKLYKTKSFIDANAVLVIAKLSLCQWQDNNTRLTFDSCFTQTLPSSYPISGLKTYYIM